MAGDDVEARLEAVERALADRDADLTGITEAAERERELDELRDRIGDLESELTDLAASVQAVRGYVGNVRTVNRDVERRADAALAKVEELERSGTDSDGRQLDVDREGSTQRTRERPQSDSRGDGPQESPGEIARRITGRDGGKREGRSPHERGARDGERNRRDGADGRSRDRPRDGRGSAVGSRGNDDQEDGFLSGLRDVL